MAEPLVVKCKECGATPRFVEADPKWPRRFGVRVQCPKCGSFGVACRTRPIAAAAWNAQMRDR